MFKKSILIKSIFISILLLAVPYHVFSQDNLIELQLSSTDSFPANSKFDFYGRFIGHFEKINLNSNKFCFKLYNGKQINNTHYGKVFIDKKRLYFVIASKWDLNFYDTNGTKLFNLSRDEYSFGLDNIAITSNGKFYITNYTNGKKVIQKYNRKGKLLWEYFIKESVATKIFLHHKKKLLFISTGINDKNQEYVTCSLVDKNSNLINQVSKQGIYPLILNRNNYSIAFNSLYKQLIIFIVENKQIKFSSIDFQDNNQARRPFAFDSHKSNILSFIVTKDSSRQLEFHNLYGNDDQYKDLGMIELRKPLDARNVKYLFYHQKKRKIRILMMDNRMFSFKIK